MEGGFRIPIKRKIRGMIFKRKRPMKNMVRIVVVTQVILLLFININMILTTSSLTWHIEIADPMFASDPSIAVDGNNNPHIAYVEFDGISDFDLKYGVKIGSNWDLEIVDSEEQFYREPSIAVDSNGIPHISYSMGLTLKYARKSGPTWVNETISTGAQCSSITINSSDVPHISYFWHNGITDMDELKYAVKSGMSWTIETVETYLNGGGEGGTSIELDSNGDPHISYLANATIKYATKNGGSWSIEILDSGASNKHTSIALNASDNPHIGYWNESNWDLKYTEKDGASWTYETVESLGSDRGGDISMAIDSNGNPLIGYSNFQSDYIKYAVRSGGNWIIDIIDDGSESSMTLDANDNPHFSYLIPGPVFGLNYATLVPDLEITKVDIVFDPPSPVNNGTSVFINATIHNIGDADAYNVMVRFYDGNPGDPLGSGPGTPINGDQIITLITSKNVGFAEVLWNATPIGNHTIYVVIDPFRLILEYDKTNNIANKTIVVGNVLYEGWNLISVPLIQSDTNIDSVLDPITGSYDAVQRYNVSDTIDLWKHHHIQKPSHMNDLNKINHLMGFWIHIIEPGGVIFEYKGIKPTQNQSIPLHIGWNLVGYPSLTNHNRTVGLNSVIYGPDVDCIQWYDASTQTWLFMGPDDLFLPGRGYWVHSKMEKVWEVPL